MKGNSDRNLIRVTGEASNPVGEPAPMITEWFWETDSDHRYTYVSSQNGVVTGFSAAQVIGRRREEFAFDRDDPKWDRHLADLATHRPFWGFEYPIELPSGRIIHLSVSGEPRFDDDGRFLGYRGAASDITERRRIEQELREAKELFRAVLDNAPFGIVLKDRDGRYVEVSREWQRRFGLARDQVVGKMPSEILPPDLAKAYEARDAETIILGETTVREERLEHADGDDEYFLSTRFPTRDGDANFTGVGLISTDITAQKLAELANAESEQQIRAIADNLPVLIARHDREWRHRFINREGASWYGVNPAQLLGKAVPDLLSRETCEVIRPLVDRVLCGEAAHFSGIVEYPDGKARHVMINYVPDIAADGSIQGWFSLAVDVTDREEAERALRESEEERRTVTDNLPVLMARFDRDWRYRYINREGARWYGMAPEDVVGRTIPDLFSAETVEDIRPSVEAALRGENAQFTGAMLYPDGAVRSIEITFVPDRTPEGDVQGWLALAQDMTERERALQALRDSEGQLRAVTDNLPILMVRWDRGMTYRFANKYAELWYGRPASEIIGRTIPDVFGTEAFETVRWAIEEALSGQTIRFEQLLKYPDGVTRHVDIAYIPDCTADGAVVGCFALVQDISARKSAEQALRESEARLQAIVKFAPAGVYLKDLEGRFVLANPEYASWYGQGANEIIGKMSQELFPESGSSRFVEHDRAVIRERRFVSMEDEARHRDGTVRTILINKFPVLDDEGTVMAVGGVDLDVTAFKNVERALRESETRLRAIVDNLPAFIIYADSDQRYRFANRTAEEWYGMPASEIIGRRVPDIVPPGSYEKLSPRIELILNGQDVRLEDMLLYPDGITRIVDQRWIADRDEDGHTRGWFALGQDITERKRLEADLLRQERLATLGQLTGTVAHELRNPLGAVAASVAALRRKTADADLDVERSLGRAERGIWRCERIITELLDFARAKGLQRQPTSFSGWISTVLSEHEIPVGIVLSTEFSDGSLEISVDREDIRRAIINIVDNACHALTEDDRPNRPEQGRIVIAARKAGDRLICEITDNGPGIPSDSLSRVMEPLFSTKSFGTGLGLPTVQRILEAHGGGVQIDSTPGQGTLVSFWLPIAELPVGNNGDVRTENIDR